MQERLGANLNGWQHDLVPCRSSELQWLATEGSKEDECTMVLPSVFNVGDDAAEMVPIGKYQTCSISKSIAIISSSVS